jgi:hypothetical protein
VTSERHARILLKRVAHLRQLVRELETDSHEWACDAELQLTFSRVKTQLDDAKLVLSIFQPMKKH